ncbi:MAG: hypothetical protein ABIY52_09975 [Gemmatimonadaceae bacterium]
MAEMSVSGRSGSAAALAANAMFSSSEDDRAHWELNVGVTAVRSGGVVPTGYFGVSQSWRRVFVSAGAEAVAVLGPAGAGSIRPYVVAGTVSTPATPHDTISPSEAALRQSAVTDRPKLRNAVVPVLQLSTFWGATTFRARIGFPLSACCARVFVGQSVRHAGWIDADLTRQLSPSIGIVTRLSTREGGVVRQDQPTSFRLSAGVSLRQRARRGERDDPRSRLSPEEPADAVLGFSISNDDSSSDSHATGSDTSSQGAGQGIARTVSLRAPSARTVELRSDLSEWKIIAMRRAAGGVWQVHLNAARGLHLVSVRVNGGAWRSPPGLSVSADDFGDEMGAVLIDAHGAVSYNTITPSRH